MSDILIQSALKEQQRLTEELIQAQADAANAALAAAIPFNDEFELISAGTYAYQATMVCNLCFYPQPSAGGYPSKNSLCYRDSFADMGDVIEKQWCCAFHQKWKPKPHGFFCFDNTYGRCQRNGLFCVPEGVNRVQVQIWGPGSGSGGFCCQGFSMPGPSAGYMLFEMNVEQGDCFCFCTGCAYCCTGDGTNMPGQNNNYCSSVCYCKPGVEAVEFFAAGAPDPHVCRWNCHHCMRWGWPNTCNMMFGGNWAVTGDMELDGQAGCRCGFGAGFACLGGMQACSGCWSPCYDSPSDAMFIPPTHDAYCIGYSNMYSRTEYSCKYDPEIYVIPAMWPGISINPTCCFGGPVGSSDQVIFSTPVPGFNKSYFVHSNDNMSTRQSGPMSGYCCHGNCFGFHYCHGFNRFPGKGGTGYATGGTNQLGCGAFGGGGAICISWSCANEEFDPYAPW